MEFKSINLTIFFECYNQVSNLVSLNELLNTTLKIDAKIVDRYLNLLEKSFISRLEGFSRNLINEINSKSNYRQIKYKFIFNTVHDFGLLV